MNKTWIGNEKEMNRKWLAIQAPCIIYYPRFKHFLGICGAAQFPNWFGAWNTIVFQYIIDDRLVKEKMHFYFFVRRILVIVSSNFFRWKEMKRNEWKWEGHEYIGMNKK